MNYPTQADNPATATTYNGWSNYETWNASLYINNEFNLYEMACAFVRERRYYKKTVDYQGLIPMLQNVAGPRTPDGVAWSDAANSEMTEMLNDLVD